MVINYKLKASHTKKTAMQSTPKLYILRAKYAAFNSMSTGYRVPENKLNIQITHLLELFITPCIIKKSTASRIVRCWCLEEINGNHQEIYNNSRTRKWGHLISWTEAIFRGEKANVIIHIIRLHIPFFSHTAKRLTKHSHRNSSHNNKHEVLAIFLKVLCLLFQKMWFLDMLQGPSQITPPCTNSNLEI